MDFHTLALQRCSTRAFDSERPIPEEVLHRILEAGRLAPSAKNLQPWRFLVVRSPELLQKVHESYPRDWIRQAPCILIVVGRRAEAWVRKGDGYNSLETDLAIALDHMILAAEAEGVGTCWIGAFDLAVLKEALKLTDDDEIFAYTPLGYASEDYTPVTKKRKPFDEVVEFL